MSTAISIRVILSSPVGHCHSQPSAAPRKLRGGPSAPWSLTCAANSRRLAGREAQHRGAGDAHAGSTPFGRAAQATVGLPVKGSKATVGGRAMSGQRRPPAHRTLPRRPAVRRRRPDSAVPSRQRSCARSVTAAAILANYDVCCLRIGLKSRGGAADQLALARDGRIELLLAAAAVAGFELCVGDVGAVRIE